MTRLPVLLALFAGIGATTIAAQTQSAFLQYGFGSPQCVASNSDAQTNTKKTLSTSTLPNEYAYGFTAPATIQVHGFAMFTKATGTVPFTMGTGIHQEDSTDSTKPAATASLTSTMTAGTTNGWYLTRFSTPVMVASGKNFWVTAADATNVLASSLTGGTATTVKIYYRRTNVAWTSTVIVANPGIVIFCSGTPILSASNTPKIPSTNFSVNIANAPPTSIAGLFAGISNTSGPLGALPSDLTVLGYAGSWLWASTEFALNGVTNTGGAFSWPANVPNLPGLDGFNFYVQAWVYDSKKNVMTVANGGRGTLGKN